jgi:ubiquinone/menaquinone biosynthesis C-methylase UbiE
MRARHIVLAVGALLTVGAIGCSSCKRFAYEGLGRDRWQKPEQVIEALGLGAGDRVADLGAGSGYFTFRLADVVGPEGIVFAIDVDRDMTSHLEQRVKEQERTNVRVVLAEFDDPLLPDGGVDLILIVNTYHHLEGRSAYFERLARALRPEGRIAIVEPEGGWYSWFFPHFAKREVIEREMGDAGFRLDQELDFLPRQSFLIFAR